MLYQDATTDLCRHNATECVVDLCAQRCFGDDADTSQYRNEKIELPTIRN